MTQAKLLRAGDSVLGHVVRRLLGEGGMGRVYEVWQREWELALALKVPRPEKLSSVDQFVAEAESWVGLGLHPHVVTCLYVRTIDDLPHVFAELVDGGSLSDWIRDGRLYEGGHQTALLRILDAAVQFAWGLGHAHAQRLVHQDVKPGNVMVSRQGVLKITDFGLARATPYRNRPGPAAQVGNGQVTSLGLTLQYASPEQAAGERVTYATDVWSWGVSVLEMFAGECTWTSGIAAPDVLANLLEDGPRQDQCPRLPDAVGALLERAFVQEPAARPSSMDALAAELTAIYRDVGGKPYPRTRPAAAEWVAGSLNNRAVSLFDLGRAKDGSALLKQALEVDSLQPEATFNSTLVRWRAGEMDYDEALRRVTDERLSKYLDEEAGWAGAQPVKLGLPESTRCRVLAHRAPWLAMIHGDELALYDYQFALDDYDALAAAREQQVAEEERAMWGNRPRPRTPADWADRLQELKANPELAARVAQVRGIPFLLDHQLHGWKVAVPPGTPSIVGFTSDDAHVITFDETGRLCRLWNARNGRLAGVLPVGPGPIHSVAFSSGAGGNKPLIVVVSDQVTVIDESTMRVVAKATVAEVPACSVRVNDDGTRVVVVDASGNAIVLELPSLERVATIRAQGNKFSDAAFVGALVATCTEVGPISYWEVPGARCVGTWAGQRTIACVGPSGRFIVARAGGALVFARPPAQILRKIPDAGGAELSAGGTMLYGTASTLCLLDTRSMGAAERAPFALTKPRATEELAQREAAFIGHVKEAGAALDRGDTVAAISWIDRARGEPGYERAPDSFALSRRLLALTNRGKLRQQWVTKFGACPASCLTISSDGNSALTAEPSGIRLWNLRTGVAVLASKETKADTLSLSGDGRRFAWGGEKGAVIVGEVGRGTVFQHRRKWQVAGVHLTGDGRVCVAAWRDGLIGRLDLGDGTIRWTEPDATIHRFLSVTRDARRVVFSDRTFQRLFVHDLAWGRNDLEMVVTISRWRLFRL